MIRRFLPLVMLLLSFSRAWEGAPARARDIYVDNVAGDDTRIGMRDRHSAEFSGPVRTIGKALRLRHGGKTSDPAVVGWEYTNGTPVAGFKSDRRYDPRDRANCAFFDGHVERLHYKALVRSPAGNTLWKGTGRLADFSYD